MVKENIVRLVDEIEEYITEVGEYRGKISDTKIFEAFTEYLMNKSCFIAELLELEGTVLSSWIIIDEDKTLQELRHYGSEHIEFHGLIFPADWCLEQFLKDLEEAE